MTYTIEDVRRLVPEARFYIDDEGDITAEADGYWFKLGEDSTLDLLIYTRRKLEIAVKALEQVIKDDNDPMFDPFDHAINAKNALSAIKEE